jgi:[acyl-carrier-protein] S-malonyltransferase
MKPAEQRLEPLIREANFRDLAMPLVSNVDASAIGTAHAVRNALVRQVCSPVRWVESIERMISMGVKRFVEIGPGSVLAGLVKRIDSSVQPTNINDVATLESFLGESRDGDPS